jgi:nucleotide-binding universal stress UspA family protein
MGSLCERVLMGREGDVMVVHRNWSARGPILVGIDGSEESFMALRRGLDLAVAFAAPIKAVAVYDPYFHGGVFNSISGVLTEEGKQKFNFAAQERLHDEIIDRGLEKIYQFGLDKAVAMAQEKGVGITTEVLMGKVFSQIHHYADVVGARLVVVGRRGLHREEDGPIGSNSLNLARIAHTNVLVVGRPVSNEAISGSSGQLAMSAEPDEKVERAAGPPSSNGGSPSAEVVVLRKTKLLAPEFHRHIVQGRLQGQTVRKGDKIMVYEVEGTVPESGGKVTSTTRLEFK